MDIRNRIEKLKNKMKTAGMVAALGTMTLNSTAQTIQQDQKENKIEIVEKSNKFSENYSNAIFDNNVENVKQLITNGKDFNIPDESGILPIFTAVSSDNIEITEILLKAGANPNHKDNELEGGTAVFFAKSVDMLKLLDKYKADLNAKDNSGNQPLHWFAQGISHGWNTDAVKFLINKGNSLENLDNFNPYNPECTKFCIDNNAKFNMDEAVYKASANGDAESLKVLFSNGGVKSINVVNNKEASPKTPLEVAISQMKKHEEGINIYKNSLNENDTYADMLTHSVKDWKDQKKVVELLISKGTNLNVINRCFHNDEDKQKHNETFEFVQQTAAHQIFINKMKQNQQGQ